MLKEFWLYRNILDILKVHVPYLWKKSENYLQTKPQLKTEEKEKSHDSLKLSLSATRQFWIIYKHSCMKMYIIFVHLHTHIYYFRNNLFYLVYVYLNIYIRIQFHKKCGNEF